MLGDGFLCLRRGLSVLERISGFPTHSAIIPPFNYCTIQQPHVDDLLTVFSFLSFVLSNREIRNCVHSATPSRHQETSDACICEGVTSGVQILPPFLLFVYSVLVDFSFLFQTESLVPIINKEHLM